MRSQPSHLEFDPSWAAKPVPATPEEPLHEILRETARRYPGKGMLQFELGKIAERLNDNKTALAHYKKAVQIEDGYRKQFRRMYPGREMFSRLGQNNYASAKERIAQLSG